MHTMLRLSSLTLRQPTLYLLDSRRQIPGTVHLCAFKLLSDKLKLHHNRTLISLQYFKLACEQNKMLKSGWAASEKGKLMQL